MWSDDFATAVQGRIEIIQQQQATYVDPVTGESQTLAANLSGAPTTMAPAIFLRAIGYSDITDGGNLRLSYSGDIGGGFVRLPVKPAAVMNYAPVEDRYVPDYDHTIAKTDTRPVGMFLAGVSAGLLWNVSRHFAVSLHTRALTGYPNWGAVIEGALSVQLAFGGAGSGEAPADEEDNEDEIDPAGDAPPVWSAEEDS